MERFRRTWNCEDDSDYEGLIFDSFEWENVDHGEIKFRLIERKWDFLIVREIKFENCEKKR